MSEHDVYLDLTGEQIEKLVAERGRLLHDASGANPRLNATLINGLQDIIIDLVRTLKGRDTWSCPSCAFTFMAYHANADGSMTCPLCELADAEVERDALIAERGTLQLQVDALVDRVATIGSEAFGPFPVQSVDENLTAIEHGIFQQSLQVERYRSVYDASLELRRVESTDVPGDGIAELESNVPAAQRRTMVALTKWRGVVDAELQKNGASNA